MARYRSVWRWVVSIVALWAVGSAAIIGGLWWRLMQGPLDITAVVSCLPSVVLHGEGKRHPELARLRWEHVFLSLSPGSAQDESHVQLAVDGLALVQKSGREVVSLGHLAGALALLPLLGGHVVLHDLALSEARISLRRRGTGEVGLDIPGWSWPKDQFSARGVTFSVASLRNLREAVLHHVSVSLYDEIHQKSAEAPALFYLTDSVVHHGVSTGWTGRVQAFLQTDRDKAYFHAFLAPLEAGEQHWTVMLSPVMLSHVADWMPVPVLAGFQFPVAVKAEGCFQFQSRQVEGIIPRGELTLSFGEGELVPEAGMRPLHIAEAVLHVQFIHRREGKLLQEVAALSMPSLVLRDSMGKRVSVGLEANARWDKLFAPQHLDIDIRTYLPRFDFSTLASVWPEGVMKNGRRWITHNMTSGMGDNLRLHAHLQSKAGLGHFHVAELEGDLYGHNLSVTWLRPVQPVTGIEAHAFFVTPDILQIDLAAGHMADGLGGVLSVPSGKVRISGMMAKDQYGDIQLALEGGLPSFLKVLAHPRLSLLSRRSLPLKNPKGHVAGRLEITLPFDSHVSVAEIGFKAAAHYDGLALDSDWMGTVRDGVGTLAVTSESLKVEGSGFVRHVPVTVSLEDNFRDGPPGHVMRHLVAKALLDSAILARLGVHLPEGMLKGNISVGADFLQKSLGAGHHKADVNLHFDFAQAAFTTSLWQKLQGIPSYFQAHALLQDGALTLVDGVKAEGPDMALSASMRLLNHQVYGVYIDRFRLGHNEGMMHFDWPVVGAETQPYHIVLSARLLDITSLFSVLSVSAHALENKALKIEGAASSYKAAAFLPKGKWQVEIAAQRLLYKPQKYLSDVKLTLAWQKQRLEQADFSMPDPMKVTLKMVPVAAQSGTYRLIVTADDMGRLCARFADYHRFEGGKLYIEGVFDPAVQGTDDSAGFGLGLAPFYGRLSIQEIALRHPPGFLTAATLFAPLHWGQLGRDRFEDVNMKFDVRVQDEKIILRNGQIGNAILGGTFDGALDMSKDVLSVQGTVSPFFRINAALGRLPGVGYLFAPEKGSGMIALTYSVKGAVEEPSVDVNPFVILVPGALRTILN